MKVLPLALAAVLSYGAGRVVVPAVVQSMPAAYHMSATCTLQPRAWARSLGVVAHPNRDRLAPAEARCLYRRGQKSTTPFLKTVLRTWPSPAELTAWSLSQRATEDEPRDRPLPAR